MAENKVFCALKILKESIIMRPYVMKFLDPKEIEVFARIKKAIEQIPDDVNDGMLGVDDNGNKVILSCHILARAVAKVFALEFEDGHFIYKGCIHSWVKTPSDNIIDVYPIACFGGPILVDLDDCSPWSKRNIYTADTLYFKELFSRPWFFKAVEISSKILEDHDRL